MSLAGTLTRPLLQRVDFPQYIAVGIDAPQSLVDIWLDHGHERRSVTTNAVVAALSPLTLGIMNVERVGPARLLLEERATGRPIGEIALRPARTITLPDARFHLFETVGSRNVCVPAAQFLAYSLFERWRIARQQRRQPHNFRLTHDDLLALLLFYACPRPVMLVTVPYQGRVNMFPMDLVGPTDSPWFSLALRSTSPSVVAMRESGCVALANIPLSYKTIAYGLGVHHRVPHIELNALPFKTRSSARFGLPVSVDALRIRELDIAEAHEVGSHTLFLATVGSDTGAIAPVATPEAAPLHHVSGLFGRTRLHLP